MRLDNRRDCRQILTVLFFFFFCWRRKWQRKYRRRNALCVFLFFLVVVKNERHEWKGCGKISVCEFYFIFFYDDEGYDTDFMTVGKVRVNLIRTTFLFSFLGIFIWIWCEFEFHSDLIFLMMRFVSFVTAAYCATNFDVFSRNFFLSFHALLGWVTAKLPFYSLKSFRNIFFVHCTSNLLFNLSIFYSK